MQRGQPVLPQLGVPVAQHGPPAVAASLRGEPHLECPLLVSCLPCYGTRFLSCYLYHVRCSSLTWWAFSLFLQYCVLHPLSASCKPRRVGSAKCQLECSCVRSWIVGLAPTAGRFFFYWFLIFWFHQFLGVAVPPDRLRAAALTLANAGAVFLSMVLMTFGAYIQPKAQSPAGTSGCVTPVAHT